MRPTIKMMLSILSLGAIFGCNAAYAGDTFVFDNPDDFWGITPEPQVAPPPKPVPAPASKPAVVPSPISAQSTLNVIEPNFGAPALADMQILGRWVGNVQHKVASAAGRLYIVAPNGQIKPLPPKTDTNDIVIPESSPVIEHMTSDSPKAGPAKVGLSESEEGPSFKLGQKGMLRPTVVGTRTTLVDGKSVIVGGAIISELRPAPVQEKSLARIYAKDKQNRNNRK